MRLLFSLPAPFFVTFSSVMVGYHCAEHKLSYYLERGAFIVCIGVAVDVFINQLTPMQGFDVLYLVGLSLPLVFLVAKYCSKVMVIYLGIAVITIAMVLRLQFGYGEVLHMVGIDGTSYIPEGHKSIQYRTIGLSMAGSPSFLGLVLCSLAWPLGASMLPP
jgi:hypothetical protein